MQFGFAESQDEKLRWQSSELKEPSGRFDINLGRPVNSYSACSFSDNYKAHFLVM